MAKAFKKTWEGRAQEDSFYCDSIGWDDLYLAFSKAENFFANKDYRRGRRWYFAAGKEMQRRMDHALGVEISRYSDLDSYLIHEEFGINVIRPAFCKSSVAVTETQIPVTKIPRKSKAKPEVVSLPLPGIPKRRGRPCSPNPLSNSERQRKFREKRAQELKAKLESASESFASETEADLLKWLVEAGPKLQEKAWLELGRRKGWKLP